MIGGAAGAFPPMIGWAAVTGDVSLGGIALFALIFMWTPPHFWALAYKCGDYRMRVCPCSPSFPVCWRPEQILPHLYCYCRYRWFLGGSGRRASSGALFPPLWGLCLLRCGKRVARRHQPRATPDVPLFAALPIVLFAALIFDSVVYRAIGGDGGKTGVRHAQETPGRNIALVVVVFALACYST